MEQNVSQIRCRITINVHVSVKKRHISKKNNVWNPATYNCEYAKYLPSIIDDSVITCDKVIESCGAEIKTIPTSFNEKTTTCKAQNFYISLAFF